MTVHASYRSAGQAGIRSAGSHQWRNIARSELVLGHPPVPMGDVRALGRMKKNMGRIPPVLVLSVEEHLVVNPKNGVTVTEWAIGSMIEDPKLTPEQIQFSPAVERAEPVVSVFERTMTALGADGKWHGRSEALDRCLGQAMGRSSFEREWSTAQFIETESRGRETWWKLRS